MPITVYQTYLKHINVNNYYMEIVRTRFDLNPEQEWIQARVT